MPVWLKKWRAVGISFILVVTSLTSLGAICLELPLNHEESFLKPSLQPLNSNLEQATISGTQVIQSLCSAVGSGLKFVRNHPIQTIMLGLATLPTAKAFYATNLNQTLTYAAYKNGNTFALLPIIISNASSSDYFNIVIRQDDALAGNFTGKGKVPLNSSFVDGVLNISGNATTVNSLTSQLFFSNNFNYADAIYLRPQITDMTTGEVASGNITLIAGSLLGTNLPQFKNYTRNGGGVWLDPIVLRNVAYDMPSVRFFILKEAGDLFLPSTRLNVTMINDSSSLIYSYIYLVPPSPIDQVNALLASLQYNPAQDYACDISIGVSISDATSAVYNLIILTSNAQTSTCAAIPSSGVPVSTKTQITTTGEIDLGSGMSSFPQARLTNTIASTNVGFNPGTPLGNSDRSATRTSPDTPNEDIVLLNSNQSSTSLIPLSAIISGAVAGGLIIGGSMIIAVVICVRGRNERTKPSSDQNHNHNLKNQLSQANVASVQIESPGIISNQPYDIIQSSPSPYSTISDRVLGSPHADLHHYLSFSAIPDRIPQSPYAANNAPL